MLYFELEPVLLHNRCQKPFFLGEKNFNFNQNLHLYVNTGFETQNGEEFMGKYQNCY